MTYIEIQNEVIAKYNIDICENSTCRQRTHAHVKERRICKWRRANSIQSLFTLFHEIGHIECHKSVMRRAEDEFYATEWALAQCKNYGVKVPQSIVNAYQRYIDLEKARGLRRGGKGYASLQLESPEI